MSRKTIVTAAAGWTLLIPLLSLLPPSFFSATGDIGRIPGFDKLVHATLYGVHAGLLGLSLRALNIFPLKRAFGLAALAAAFYGLVMEVLQRVLTDCRQFSWGDVLANFTGAILVSALLFLILRKRPVA